MSMAADALMHVPVIGLWGRGMALVPPDDPARRWLAVLPWCGAIAGVGLLILRLTGEAAWCTGRLTNELPGTRRHN